MQLKIQTPSPLMHYKVYIQVELSYHASPGDSGSLLFMLLPHTCPATAFKRKIPYVQRLSFIYYIMTSYGCK